jgi:hypothetical protein
MTAQDAREQQIRPNIEAATEAERKSRAIGSRL